MSLHTAGLAVLLALGAGSPPAPPSPVAVQGGGSLAHHLDGPDFYMEVFDLSALERDLRQSGIGRLAGRFAPLLECGDALAELGCDPAAVAAGETSIEDALAVAIARLLRDEVGMSEADAVRVAASLGSRVSLAHVGPEDDLWAAAWSLRPGGADVIVDTLAPHVTAVAGEDAPELVHMERGAGGLRAAWSADDGEAYVVLRDDLLAVTSSHVTMERMLGHAAAAPEGGRHPVGSAFGTARADAARRGDGFWLWLDGAALKHAAAEDGEDALDALRELGLDRVRSVQLSLAGAGGQLASRLRVDTAGNEGILGLVRGRAGAWTGLERLTADALGVAGLTRSPAEVVRELAHTIGRIEGAEEVTAGLALASGAPLVGELLAPGALGDETVLFVRPGAAGFPLVYLAAPAGPALAERLDRLGEGASAFGGELTLRRKELGGRPCWFLADGGYGLAVTIDGDTMLASYSLLGLQDYLRQRERERPEDRAALIASVRAELHHAAEASGHGAGAVAGFAHVRVEPLAEMAWPWMMMAMSMGGVEGLEDLPDAVEIAEEIGDTTLILFELGDALELRGRGLFGGLGVLF